MNSKYFVIKKTRFFLAATVLSALISSQGSKLFGVSGGIISYILYYAKYCFVAMMISYSLSLRNRKISTKETRDLVGLFVPLLILMIVTEIVALFFSPVPTMFGMSYWTRSLFTLLDRVCICVTVVAGIQLCGEETIDCITNVLLIDETLILISALFNVGIGGILSSLTSVFDMKDGGSSYFEVHELTFSMGLLLIYYLFFAEKNKVNRHRIFWLIVFFILGEKRIGFAGIVMAGIFSNLVKKKELSKRMVITVGSIGVCCCFLYLFLLYNDEFFAILAQYGINSMGRDIVFSYFTRRTKFQLGQLGWGIAGVGKVVENMDRAEVMYMAATRGLHNDILKIYIDFGFIGATLWYVYNLLYLPIKYLKRYGKRAATILFCLLIYMFITYLTDNTESYFVCQVVLFIIPIADAKLRRRNYEKD